MTSHQDRARRIANLIIAALEAHAEINLSKREKQAERILALEAELEAHREVVKMACLQPDQCDSACKCCQQKLVNLADKYRAMHEALEAADDLAKSCLSTSYDQCFSDSALNDYQHARAKVGKP